MSAAEWQFWLVMGMGAVGLLLMFVTYAEWWEDEDDDRRDG